MLAGSGTVLGAEEAQRLGVIDRVLPRADFDQGWRALARSSPPSRRGRSSTS